MYDNLRTENSRAHFEEAGRFIPDGVSSSMRRNISPLLYFSHGDGPWFFDVDGNRYIDHTLAWGPLIAGNNHPALNEAVSAQLKKGYTFGAQHALEISVARRMTEILPGVEQVLFCNTGTEAVQGAIRLARAGTGRSKIIKFEGHYHGWMNNVLVSYKPSAEQLGSPAATCGGQPLSEYTDTLIAPWNDAEALRLLFEAHPREIACVITEPLLANSGCCMPDEGYLAEVVRLCREFGAVSIFDEVITGFRIAPGGAREYFGIVPDISVYAKAIAGGFTMAAIGGSRAVFEVLTAKGTIHAGTYNGSPVNLAAAAATLELLSEPGRFANLLAYGRSLQECLESEAAKNGIPLVTSGVGSVFSVHFGLEKKPRNYTDTLSSDKGRYEKFRVGMLQKGVLLLPDGRWYTGITHGENELALTRRAIEEVMHSLNA